MYGCCVWKMHWEINCPAINYFLSKILTTSNHQLKSLISLCGCDYFAVFEVNFFFWKLCDIFKNSWGETKYCIFQNNLNSFLYIMMPILKDIATYYSGNIHVWVILWHIYLCLTNSLHTWVSQTFALLPWTKI